MNIKTLICLSLLAVGCAAPMWADAGGDPSLEQDPFEGCFRSNEPVQDICRLVRLLSEVTDKESADAVAPKVTAIWVELNAMTRMEPQERERILSVCTGFREALDELAEVLSALANEHQWYGSSLLRHACAPQSEDAWAQFRVFPEEQSWACLDGYKHRFDNMGGCEYIQALPGGYLEYTYAYGCGRVETWVYLLAPLAGERRYGVLFDAHRSGDQGDSFKVQGSTVLYHFDCAWWGKPMDKTYPLSEEGAGAFRRDGNALNRLPAGNLGVLASEDGSLLLVCAYGYNLFVRGEDGVTYHPAAAVSVNKPVQSISREGDTLILRAKDGSECRIPLGCPKLGNQSSDA